MNTAFLIGATTVIAVLILGLTQRPEGGSMFLSALVLWGAALIAIGSSIWEAKKEILDALAKGQASQGTHQPGRDATQAKGIHNKEITRLKGHWHQGYTAFGESRPPWKYESCQWHNKGLGRECPDVDPRSDEECGSRWHI